MLFRSEHPLYTPAAIRAQGKLHRIQNTRGISYAGAWTKYGFHEDGFSSGLLAAQEHLGAKLPFKFTDSTFSRGKTPQLGIADWLLRVIILAVQVLLIEVVEAVFGLGRRQSKRVLHQVNEVISNGVKSNGVKSNGIRSNGSRSNGIKTNGIKGVKNH